MKVYINQHDKNGKVIGKKIVEAELLQERPASVVVKLPDGNIVIRKKNRDLPDAQLQQPKDKK